MILKRPDKAILGLLHVRRRTKIFLIVLVILGAGIALALHLVTAPVHGAATALDVRVSTLRPSTPKAPVPSTIGNKYFSLTTPLGYEPSANSSTTAAGVLFNQTFIKTAESGSLIVTIAISPLPVGGLAGDSSYHLRQVQTSQYALSTLTMQGEPVQLATATTADGVVAFWPHGDYLATVSARTGLADYGSAESADEQRALATLLAVWHWH